MLANDRLVEHGVVVACRVAGGQPCGNAEAAQHQSLGRGELLAVPDLDVEQEPVNRVAACRYVAELLRVLEVRLQVGRQRHHHVELRRGVAGHRFGREAARLRGELSRVQVLSILARRTDSERVFFEFLRGEIWQIGHDRVGLTWPQQVRREERPVRVFAQAGDRRVEALDRVRGADHARQRAEDAKDLHEAAQVVGRRGGKEPRLDVWRQVAVAGPGRGPDAAVVGVEDEAAPVGGSAAADVHDRRVTQPSAEVEIDAAGRTGRVAAQLHQRKGRVLELAFEAHEVGERDDQGCGRERGGLRYQDERGEAGRQRADHGCGERRRRRAEPGFHPLQVGRHPETREAGRPEGEQDPEGIVPGVNRRQVQDGEADP